MKKPPAFQFYPDKFLAGTEHLSPNSFQVYVRILCWMWLHSKNQYSMPDALSHWVSASRIKGKRLEKAQSEIMQKGFELFKKRNGFLISLGLKKEAEKQAKARRDAKTSANARWNKAVTTKPKVCERNADASFSQCSLTPTPTSLKTLRLKEGSDQSTKTKTPIRNTFIANGQSLLSIVEVSGGNPRDNDTRNWDSQDLGRFYDFIVNNSAYSVSGKNEQLMYGLRILRDCCKTKKLHKPMPYWKKIMQEKYPEWRKLTQGERGTTKRRKQGERV